MKNDFLYFLLKWFGFSSILFLVHYYIQMNFLMEEDLYFPLWSIYAFNAGLVLLVYLIIVFQAARGNTKTYNLFLLLTVSKMVLAIVFLSPLFADKSANTVLDTTNFFIPYFFFLVFEIFQLNKFFKARETK